MQGVRDYGQRHCPGWRFHIAVPDAEGLEAMLAREPAGIIACLDNDRITEGLKASGVPVVEAGEWSSGFAKAIIAPSFEEAGRLAAAHYLQAFAATGCLPLVH